MRNYQILFAFGLGCLAAISIHLAAGVSAQQKKGPGPSSLDSRLKSLEQRAKELEKSNVTQPSKKVVAPFKINDSVGSPIFEVNNDGAKVFHGSYGFGAKMGGNKDGGQFVATSLSGASSFWLDTAFGVPSCSVVENNSPRIKLGKGVERENYRLGFLSGTNQQIAGIGEDPTTHTGLALIFDGSGRLRDRMGTDGRKGLVDILGLNDRPLVQLTEGGDKGGYLLICSVNGCDPPMVEAGDAGGYGIVRAGPHMFQRGVTMLDLPGSVIMGKSQ